MPKRAVKKRLKRIKKGGLVKWIRADEVTKIFGRVASASEQNKHNLKRGDLGIILGVDKKPQRIWGKKSNQYFTVYWHRIGKKRTMYFRDFQILGNKT